jgi:hypothetical protein
MRHSGRAPFSPRRWVGFPAIGKGTAGRGFQAVGARSSSGAVGAGSCSA